MAKHSVNAVSAAFPEVKSFESAIVEGANLELHELPTKHTEYENLRIEIGGTNWAADRPDRLWNHALEAYRSGDVRRAYVLVGVLMHYSQDMGLPAHAYHVIHQGSLFKADNIEMLAFFDFHGDMGQAPVDPGLASPVDYIEWSAQSARTHFETVFPGETYTRRFFPQAYDDLTETHWAFLKTREAHATYASDYTLRSAAAALAKLHK
jgi:hypothetical protein